MINSITHPEESNFASFRQVSLDFSNLATFINSNKHTENIKRSLPAEIAFPVKGIFEFVNVFLIGQNGWVYNQKFKSFEFLTWFNEIDEKRIIELKNRIDAENRKRLSGTRRVLRGTTLSLLSDWALDNWGHFLLDSIGRVSLLDVPSEYFESFDQVLIPNYRGSHAKHLVAKIFDSAKNVILVERDDVFVVEYLTIPTAPSHQRMYSADAPKYFRSLMDNVPEGRFDCYVPRNVSPRKFHEPQRLISILEKTEVNVFVPIDQASPHKGFDIAGAIVGVHGAALSGIVFAPNTASFCEIQHVKHRFPYFQSIAISMGIRSEIILYESKNRSKFLPQFNKSIISSEDFEILEEFLGLERTT